MFDWLNLSTWIVAMIGVCQYVACSMRNDSNISLRGGATIEYVNPQKMVFWAARAKSSCLSHSSHIELVLVHLEKYLPLFSHEHPLLKTIVSHLDIRQEHSFKKKLQWLYFDLWFCLQCCFFHNSKNLNWSWNLSEKFTGWNKIRIFQPVTEFRISLCT